MHLPVGAMMLLGGAEKGARFDAPVGDRISALILTCAVAGAPIVETAIINNWSQMQEVRMGSRDEQELVGMTWRRFQEFDLATWRRRADTCRW